MAKRMKAWRGVVAVDCNNEALGPAFEEDGSGEKYLRACWGSQMTGKYGVRIARVEVREVVAKKPAKKAKKGAKR